MNKTTDPQAQGSANDRSDDRTADLVSARAHEERTFRAPETGDAAASSADASQFRLRFDEDFVQFVHTNLWATRRERGYPWRKDVFEFIEEVYRPWRGKGLVQADIKALDPKLYAQLHKMLTALSEDEKAAILTRLELPKESDARLEAISDAEARERLLKARSSSRRSMRQLRSLH